MRKILAIVQARTSSTRLPKKVLLPVCEMPMILFQLERISRSKFINKIVVATSNDKSDDNLNKILKNCGYFVFRGSLDNVLDRFAKCCEIENPDIVLRLTGDCPLTDPNLIDEIINFYINSDYEYLGNGIDEENLSVPDGFDIEVFSAKTLRLASKNAYLPSELEHVTPWFRKSESNIKWKHFNHSKKRPFYRVTVDDPVDYQLIKIITNELYPKNKYFDIDDVINFLNKNPKLVSLNKTTVRNEGLLKSLKEDNFFSTS